MIIFTEVASVFLKGFRYNKISLAGMIIISISFPLLVPFPRSYSINIYDIIFQKKTYPAPDTINK